MKNLVNKVKLLTMGFLVCLFATMFFATEVSATTIKPTQWKNIYNSNTQGMCMDDKGNAYVAQISGTKAVIYKVATNGTITKVVERASALGHANDMTFCSKNGYLYVATGGDNNTDQEYDVIAFDTNKKDSNGQLKVVGKYMVYQFDNYISGIAYSSKYNVFYVKQGKTIRVGKFKNGEFESISSFKLDYGSHDGYVNQGIAAKGDRLYVPLWDDEGQKNSVVKVYTVTKNSDGKFTHKYYHAYRYDNNTSKTDKFEIESVGFYSGKMYFSVNSSDDAIFQTSTY